MSALKEMADYHRFTGRAEMHKSVNSLVGLLTGIAADRVIDAKEYAEL